MPLEKLTMEEAVEDVVRVPGWAVATGRNRAQLAALQQQRVRVVGDDELHTAPAHVDDELRLGAQVGRVPHAEADLWELLATILATSR